MAMLTSLEYTIVIYWQHRRLNLLHGVIWTKNQDFRYPSSL